MIAITLVAGFIVFAIISSISVVAGIPSSTLTLSAPVLKTSHSLVLTDIAAGQQANISTTISHDFPNEIHQTVIIIIEARDMDGVTKYLAWQLQELQGHDQIEIQTLWTPDSPGSYQLRTFAITNFSNPEILTPVSESKIMITAEDSDSSGGTGYNQTIVLVNNKTLIANVAMTPLQQKLGLSVKQNLSENEAMLFVFDQESSQSFWMKGMKFPIDIIWLDADKRIVHIEQSLPPCEDGGKCPVFSPEEDALYVLETVSNFTQKYDIQVGEKMWFIDCQDYSRDSCSNNMS